VKLASVKLPAKSCRALPGMDGCVRPYMGIARDGCLARLRFKL